MSRMRAPAVRCGDRTGLPTLTTRRAAAPLCPRILRHAALVLGALGLIVSACGPRTRKGAAAPGTASATPVATFTATAIDTGPATPTGLPTSPTSTGGPDGTTAGIPELPPILGPAWTPTGLSWPPGLPPIAVPPGFPTVIAPWPSVFPFPVPTAPPTTTGTATPPPPPTTGTDNAAWMAIETEVLVETNARRAQGASCGGKIYAPAKPLMAQTSLQKSARGHSTDMAVRNYFDHLSPEGTTPTQRMKAAGYSAVGLTGENIAAGNATAKATVQQWIDSPGHCENMMNPRYTLLGVGYAFTNDTKYHHYWTQNFAGP